MRNPYRRGFSAVDVATTTVFVGLIALVIVPILGGLREQSRIATCISNLGTIGRAQTVYYGEYEDLPWALTFQYQPAGFPRGTWVVASEYVWGGGMPQKTNEELQQQGIPTVIDIQRVPPRVRPLNRYIDPLVSWDNRDRDTEEARLALPMQLPGCFKCPSDSSVEVPTLGLNDPHPGPIGRRVATWDYLGTSYAMNWHWTEYFRFAPPGDRAPYNSSLSRILGLRPFTASLGREALRRSAEHWASRFIALSENRSYYLFANAKPRNGSGTPWQFTLSSTGWHGRHNWHAALFLDGSARYQFMDTRYPTGPGWAIWPPPPWEGVWRVFSEFNE